MFRDEETARAAQESLRRQYACVHLCKNTDRVV